MVDQEVVELQVPRSKEYVSIVRNTVEDIARRMHFESNDIDDLKLAVGEACANAVRHGCPESSTCDIRVSCCIEPSEIAIEIRNKVKASDKQPKITTNPDITREGGLGLYLMRNLMDEVDLRWRDGWATVRMVKKVRR
jgi:serine/threonine-protein kinase RsbW